FSLSEKLEILNLQDIKLVAVANAESCDGVIDSNENAFCKNRPSINCGYCRVYPSGTACEFTIASNHDCYDTGH
ncbi:MAG TPA: hypothetical protein VEP89_03505, partial [Draconibacterium sp.]|nr:hypothetical protein [Draconibacterium sp.]